MCPLSHFLSCPVRWKSRATIPATGPSFDLRDSGSIEQDADCVLFLYRDSYYASQNPDGAEVDADTAECIVAKNRHGETSTVPLGWDGAHTRFMDVDF